MTNFYRIPSLVTLVLLSYVPTILLQLLLQPALSHGSGINEKEEGTMRKVLNKMKSQKKVSFRDNDRRDSGTLERINRPYRGPMDEDFANSYEDHTKKKLVKRKSITTIPFVFNWEGVPDDSQKVTTDRYFDQVHQDAKRGIFYYDVEPPHDSDVEPYDDYDYDTNYGDYGDHLANAMAKKRSPHRSFNVWRQKIGMRRRKKAEEILAFRKNNPSIDE